MTTFLLATALQNNRSNKNHDNQHNESKQKTKPQTTTLSLLTFSCEIETHFLDLMHDTNIHASKIDF